MVFEIQMKLFPHHRKNLLALSCFFGKLFPPEQASQEEAKGHRGEQGYVGSYHSLSLCTVTVSAWQAT